MLNDINNTGNGLNSRDLEGAENELGYALPKAYKDFLLKYNGGKPVESYIDFDAKKLKLQSGRVKKFYGLGVKPTYDIVYNMKEFGYQLPEGLIFIANTHGGSFFLISLRGDSYGEVFYKDHEFEDFSNFDPNSNILPESIVKVSNNFDDFLARLYDIDE